MRILCFAGDEKAPVWLRWFQTSESIGAATPELYENHMMIFEKLFHDPVRMEAPEIVHVSGRRTPEFVRLLPEELKKRTDTDRPRVARIHGLRAVKVAGC